ncbi:MAG: IPT/TIG domain-containing protein [bacterium]|jgi:hypothetical protein
MKYSYAYLIAIAIFSMLSALTSCGKGGTVLEPGPSGPGLAPGELRLEILRDESGLPRGVRLDWFRSSQPDVRGYNIYKRQSPFTVPSEATKVNSTIVSGGSGPLAQYFDYFSPMIGQTYYYGLTTVDIEGDESALSTVMSITIGAHQVTTFSPVRGMPGSTVTISGMNFGEYNSATDKVYFWGIGGSTVSSAGQRQPSETVVQGQLEAEVVSWSASTIVARVPANTTSGPIGVSINGVVSQTVEVFTSSAPYLLSVLPDPVNEGELVQLEGNNFGNFVGTSTVRFGIRSIDNRTAGLSWSNTLISFPVPSGLDGLTEVWVNVTGAPQSNHVFTTVIPNLTPTITNVFPQKAQPGTDISIYGTKFGNTPGSIDFNGVTIDAVSTDLISWADTEIHVSLPAGAEHTGTVQVTNSQPLSSNTWYYRLGTPSDFYKFQQSRLIAGEMTGLGTSSCFDGTFIHTFTIGGNATALRYDKTEPGAGFETYYLFPGNYSGAVGCAYSGGAVWVAFARNGIIEVSSSADGGFTWDPPTAITSTPSEIGWVSACTDFDGRIYVAWGDMTDKAVYFASFDSSGSQWIVETVTTTNYVGGQVDVAVINYPEGAPPEGSPPPAFGDNDAFVSYTDLVGTSVRVSSNSSGSWQSMGTPGTNSAGAHSLLMISYNTPAIVYHFQNQTSHAARLVFWNGNGWTTRTLSNVPTGHYDAIYDDGFVYVATGDTQGTALLYRHDFYTPSTTTFSYEVPGTNAEFYSSIVVDLNGNIHSTHTDTVSWDYYMVDWDTSGGGAHGSFLLGDGYGDCDLLSGDDQIANDFNGGTGFLFKDITFNKLYFGFESGGITQITEIESGGPTDFLSGGLDAQGSVYHIFYQVGPELMYRTYDASDDILSPSEMVGSGSIGDVGFTDMAVLSGSPEGTNASCLFVHTSATSTINRTLKLASLLPGGGWDIRDVDNLGVTAPIGIDLVIRPDGEQLTPVYYDPGSSEALWLEFTGGVWVKHPINLTDGIGENPAMDGLSVQGMEGAGISPGAGFIDMFYQQGTNWVQDRISTSALSTSPFDYYCGYNAILSGWTSYAPFFDTAFYCAVGTAPGSVSNVPLNFIVTPTGVDAVSGAIDLEGGLSAVYSGNFEHGVYYGFRRVTAVE